MAALPSTATVAVFGAGAMGAGIAQIAAQAGHRVQLFDARFNAAEEGRKKIGQALSSLAAKGRLSNEAAKGALARIDVVHALGDVASARLVIEAIVEDLEAKRDLFRKLEVVVARDAILATNTSSLSVTALSAGLQHPGRVVGMHFFNPAPLLPLVEVVSGLGTDPDVARAIYDTAQAWGKIPVHASSTPGFIVNRCARPFYAEALRLLAERAADPATLDAVMREAGGFRMGPFELMDLIGHDINFAVTRSVWEAHFHDARFTPSVYQQELVSAGHLGRKSGRGVYDYAEGAQKPAPRTEPPRSGPARIVAYGDLRAANALVDRIAALGVPVERHEPRPPFPTGVIAAGGAWLAMSDGRSATSRSTDGVRDLVLFDLAYDYHATKRLAVSRADSCSDAAYGAAVGLLQTAGIAVSPIDDVGGLPVIRTVAMLANEAADAVQQGIASPRDIDLAMQKGVNYPQGPLAWADAIGCDLVRETLVALHAHYGDARYRVSPLITRRCASRAPLAS